MRKKRKEKEKQHGAGKPQIKTGNERGLWMENREMGVVELGPKGKEG